MQITELLTQDAEEPSVERSLVPLVHIKRDHRHVSGRGPRKVGETSPSVNTRGPHRGEVVGVGPSYVDP